jgi:hypothetical protein
MLRHIGTILICFGMLVLLGSSSAFAGSPQQYGIEVRGGFGQYNMGDVTPGIKSIHAAMVAKGMTASLELKDSGPAGGFSLVYRPTRHSMWEVGYNALFDVNNKSNSTPDTASGQILMHANEFFVKGTLVATVTDLLHVDMGLGLAYYNAELQIQDQATPAYYYDADGRAFGLVGTVGVEYLLTKRIGVILQGGGRIANTTHFTYINTSLRAREGLEILPNGGRPFEVNLSGAYGQAGLRFYFDPVTKPVDFTR